MLHTVGGGSVTRDLQEVGLLEAHTASNGSGASLQLELTIFNCIEHFSGVLSAVHVLIHVLKFPEKPRSATHSSTSTTSTGLLCLLVGVHVHYGRRHG